MEFLKGVAVGIAEQFLSLKNRNKFMVAIGYNNTGKQSDGFDFYQSKINNA